MEQIRENLGKSLGLENVCDTLLLKEASQFRRSLDHVWNRMYGSPSVLQNLFPEYCKEPPAFWNSAWEEDSQRNIVKYKFPFSSEEYSIYLSKGEAMKITFYLAAIFYLSFITGTAFKYHR